MLNMEFFQELFEPPAIELGAVVSDDGSRKGIMAYNRLSNERLCLGLSGVGHELSFDPFGEVIHGTEEKLLLHVAFRKDPKMSIPHCSKGHGKMRGVSSMAERCLVGACLWQKS